MYSPLITWCMIGKILNRHILATILLRTIFTGRFSCAESLEYNWFDYFFHNTYQFWQPNKWKFSPSLIYSFFKDFSQDLWHLCYWFLSHKNSLARRNWSTKETIFSSLQRSLYLLSLLIFIRFYSIIQISCSKVNCCWRSNHK